MIADHPLTELILNEAGYPEIITISHLRRPHTDIVVRIRWRQGTGPTLIPSKLGDVKVTSIGPNRLPDQEIRWRYPWGHVAELAELIEQSAWSLGASYVQRFAKAPYSGPLHYSDPAVGIRPAFCGIGHCYSFPGSGEVSMGQMDNVDLVEEAARTGYWFWRFDVRYRMHSAHHLHRSKLKAIRVNDLTILEDGSRAGEFPGWQPGKSRGGRSGEWWLATAREFETDDTTSLLLEFDVTGRCVCWP
jgi:hypothetical protein